MSTYHLYRAVQLVIVLSACVTHAATDGGVNTESSITTNSPKTYEPFSTTDPMDTVSTVALDTFATGSAETVTQDGVSTVTTDLAPSSEATTEPVIETVPPPVETTAKSSLIPKVCLCDLTPDFCDIGCCCDIVDCDIPDLSSVFNGCLDEVIYGECIESWLIFRVNVDPSCVTVTNKFVCIRPEEDNTTVSQILPALANTPLDSSYHFSWKGSATYSTHTKDFYRVDDTIMSHFNSSSIRGVLRQPSPGAATSSCVDRNPARFLRSISLSCTRTLTPLSCATDPSLNAQSYFHDISLLKIPVRESIQILPDNLIPITPVVGHGWPKPREQNGSCLNVVSKVDYLIWYTIIGEIAMATVNMVLVDTDSDTNLLQKHTVRFQLSTPPPTPEPTPVVGLTMGTPVIGQFGDAVQPLTLLGVSLGGECSINPSSRMPILFTHNTITGCTFSSPSSNCSKLRSQLYRVLRGVATPNLVAMTVGSQPDWARVITQACSVTPQSPEESCESGCLLPHSLSVQVLWAQTGLLAFPQNYILGAKYLFHCQKVKCPLVSPFAVTTEVMFVDTTVYPEPPRGTPQPKWKFPFDFFSRGTGELDGQTVTTNSSDLKKVTWDIMLVVLLLLCWFH
ncbi:tectonic-3-like isoform X1 [Oncorhynchus keta]|uniref:tectonic-3-like isoform X1 n=2 Tax=Oncorhynchus keta TaxID=8018 RepID=UPI0015FA90EA|nr:tectonic-3-like isoform X1 [Oncorhynchus keta]